MWIWVTKSAAFVKFSFKYEQRDESKTMMKDEDIGVKQK